MDVGTGELVEGPIDRCRYSTIGWVPGGAEFYYVRRLPPEQVPQGEEQFHRRVYRHRIGTGLVWRSAQPTPHQLAWFKRQGVRTVISLRGGRVTARLGSGRGRLGGVLGPAATAAHEADERDDGEDEDADDEEQVVLEGVHAAILAKVDARHTTRRPAGATPDGR